MILKFLIILSSSLLFSQVSSLSFYGQGELLNVHDASGIAQGNSSFFGLNKNGFSLSSSSTFYKNRYSLLSVSFKFSSNYIDNLEENLKNNFQLLFFSIPLKNNKSVSFGMRPLYRSDINVNDDEYFYIGSDELSPLVNLNNNLNFNGPIRYKSSFNLDGGLSEFITSFSSKIGEKSSIGISLSRIFGSSKYRYNVDLFNLSYTPDNVIIESPFSQNNYVVNQQRYAANRYLIEFNSSINKINFVFNYSKSSLLKVKLKEEVHFSSLIYDESANHTNQSRMHSKGFGFKYNCKEYLSINTEYQKIKSFKPYDYLNIFSLQNPDMSSLGLGLNYVLNDKNDYYDSLNLRMGTFRINYSYDEFNVIDNGFTIGLGVNYLDEKNSLNFAFKMGTRKSSSAYFNNERYFNFYFTINSSENWFNNERN